MGAATKVSRSAANKPDWLLARLLIAHAQSGSPSVPLPVLAREWATTLGYSREEWDSNPALRKRMLARLYRRFKPAPEELLSEFHALDYELRTLKLRLIRLSLAPLTREERQEYLRLKAEIKALEAKLDLLEEEIRSSSGSWVKAGLAWSFRADGLIWTSPCRPLLDLMWARALSRQHSPRRFHRDRRLALRLLATRRRLKDSDWAELYNLYSHYLEDTAKRVLVFEPAKGGSCFIRPYSHRFTPEYARKLLARFDAIWEAASCFYSCGVFLTLTLNPSDWPNILEASRAIHHLLSRRLLALLARRPSCGYLLLRIEALTLWSRILQLLKAQRREKKALAKLKSPEDLAQLLAEILDPRQPSVHLLDGLPLIQALLDGRKQVRAEELGDLRSLISPLLKAGWLAKQELAFLDIPGRIHLGRLLAPLGLSSATPRWIKLAQILILTSIPRLGERLDYLAVLEPHDSGMPHLHIVLFGLAFLGPHHLVSLLLVRLGFGMVHHACSIKQKKPGKWAWSKSRPRGAKSSPPAYLRKYLKKMLSDLLSDEELGSPGSPPRLLAFDKVAWFWATGKRFFTHSRRLLARSIGPWKPWRIRKVRRLTLPPSEVLIKTLARPLVRRVALYRFVGCFYRWEWESRVAWGAWRFTRRYLEPGPIPRQDLPQLLRLILSQVRR